MAKNIVLCSDGTGNAGGKGRGTNVWQAFLGVERNDPEHEQIAFYDDGVGSSESQLAILGKAFGYGLSRNIRQLYTALVRSYEVGDKLYLFGFSRGAFTIRSLAAMISEVGVLDRHSLEEDELEAAVEAAYKGYRQQLGFGGPAAFQQWCADQAYGLHQPEVHFLGVWDTVNAIGLPVTELRKPVQMLAFARRPHLHDLNAKLVHVRHAMAIDETRQSFKLEMFDERKRQKDWPLESVEQVWFPGVHSSVGGGYPKKGLESVSLHWMLREAEAVGLRIDRASMARAEQLANSHSKMYDSRAGLARFYRYKVRHVEELTKEEGGAETKVHVSAMERIQRATEAYGPINMPPESRVVGTRTAEEGSKPSLVANTAEKTIEGFQQLLQEGRAELTEMVKPGRRIARQRNILYWCFLLPCLFMASVVLSQHAVEKGVGEGFFRPAVRWFEGISRWLDSLFGWFRPVFDKFSGVADLFLPDLLAGPLSGLGSVPSLAGAFTLILFVVYILRDSLLRRARSLGRRHWGKVLDRLPGREQEQ